MPVKAMRKPETKAAPTIVEPENESREFGHSGIQIVGRLGADPELRYTPNGVAVCSLRVAVNHMDGETTWFNVSVWGSQAEFANNYLRTGRRVFIAGTFSTRPYESKAGESKISLDVNASAIQFADSKPTDE